MITLGLLLAAIEDSLTRHTWREPTAEARRYFDALAGWGYQLSDVEQVVISKPTKTG